MDWAPGFMPPMEEEDDDEMAEGGDFQNGDVQNGDAQDEGFENESLEDEMSQDEVFQDEVFEDEILRDEVFGDEASQDAYPQDEASHDTPTPLIETGRIPSQRASDGSRESYAKILTYVKSVRRTPSEAATIGDCFTLLVGPDEYVICIIHEWLCHKFKYFDMLAQLTHLARFPEADPRCFEIMLMYAFDDTLPPVDYSEVNGENKLSSNWDPFKLYQLAATLSEPEFMDRALQALRDGLARKYLSLNLGDIDEGYTRSPLNSTMRQFLSYVVAYKLMCTKGDQVGWTNSEMQQLCKKHPDLGCDIVPHMRRTKKVFLANIWDVWPDCELHNHPNDGSCPYKKLNIPSESRIREWVALGF